MSKTMKTRIEPAYRLRLLATASAMALMSSMCCTVQADASGSDADRPLIWLEAGWQFERTGGGNEIFAPAFTDGFSSAHLTSVSKTEKLLPYSSGAEASLSFQPENSDWIFSGSVRFGRAHARKRLHEERTVAPQRFHHPTRNNPAYYRTLTAPANFGETAASNDENHLIVDFQAGKDVGLGLFGHRSKSAFGFGIRFAQFRSQSGDTLYGRVNSHISQLVPFPARPQLIIELPVFHSYAAVAHMSRNFQGIGPSITWNNSSPLVGDAEDGEVTLDWGASAALLFGRQKTSASHQLTTNIVSSNIFHRYVVIANGPTNSTRRHSVAVPNIGGFAGLSYRIQDFKMSMGYRADLFFGAIDGGIDARKSYDRGFYGPFASIAVGIGD